MERLYQRALGLFKNPQDAEDFAQDVMVLFLTGTRKRTLDQIKIDWMRAKFGDKRHGGVRVFLPIFTDDHVYNPSFDAFDLDTIIKSVHDEDDKTTLKLLRDGYGTHEIAEIFQTHDAIISRRVRRITDGLCKKMCAEMRR